MLAALLNNAAPLPPTPPVAHAPLPTPKSDPIKSTIGEIDGFALKVGAGVVKVVHERRTVECR